MLARVRGGEAQVVLRMKAARAYQDELHRPDLAQNHLAVAIGLSPEDPLPSVRLAKLHLDNGRPDLALPELRRALEIAPLHAEALRGIGGAFMRTGVADAGRFLDDIAAIGEGEPPSGKAMPPLIVKRPLDPSEWAIHFPRTSTGPVHAMAEIARQLEPYAPALLVETTGQIPRGDLLPEANPVSLRVRAVATALGLEPMRVYVDAPKEREVPPVRRRQARRRGRRRADLGRRAGTADVRGRAPVGVDGGGRDHRRLPGDGGGAGVPHGHRHRRRRRGHQGAAPPRDQAAAAQGAQGDRAHRRRGHPRSGARRHRVARRGAALGRSRGFLLSRDAAAAMEAVAGGKDPHTTTRALDLVRYLASDGCWRAYVRLTT